MLPMVRISRDALETMLVAAVETFKKECFGFVFGRAPTKWYPDFTITKITPLQMARKRFGGTDAHTQSECRMNSIFTLLPLRSRPLGRFHSHTEWGKKHYRTTMSKVDILCMASEKAKIEFVIAISSRKKLNVPWRAHRNGSICGAFGKEKYKYYFSVNAYILEGRITENEPKPMRLKIIAPEAIRALNRALGYR